MARERISMVELSKRFGVSRDTITRWVNSGHVPSHQVDGKRVLYREEAMKAAQVYSDSRSPADQLKVGISGDGKKPNSKSSEIHIVKTSFERSKAIKESFSAKMARVKYEEQLKQLVKVDVVEKRLFELALLVRDAMLTIPSKISPELASMTDEKKIRNYIDKTIRDHLKLISEGEFNKIKKGIRK